MSNLINPHVHELSVNRGDELVVVSLRLTTAGQISLKKRWNENTISTLFGAIDDVERFADVLTQALNYPGNQNVIKKGDELADLLADNDLSGIANKQKLMSAIGRASGILSEQEKEKMDRNADKMMDGLSEDEDNKGNV
jgi:F0F1-type ATP synthase alpha subunit